MDIEEWLVPAAAHALLFLLLAGMAATVDTAILRDKFRRRASILLGLLCQFVVLPLVGFASVKIFDLPPVYGITLLAVVSSPGGAYSNWWCSLFNADLALSIAMTTCSTLVSIAFTPLNLFIYVSNIYGEVPNLDWVKMLLSIAVALLAIPAGICCGYFFPRHRSKFNFAGNLAGLSLIVFSAVVSSRGEPIWDKRLWFYPAIASPCLSGLVLAFLLGHLSPCISGPEAVAVTVETGYQNTGLAMTIALATFSGEDRDEAVGVPLYYACVQVICLPLFLVFAWKAGLTYAPRDANLLRVVLQNFQPRGGRQVSPALQVEVSEATADGGVEAAESARKGPTIAKEGSLKSTALDSSWDSGTDSTGISRPQSSNTTASANVSLEPSERSTWVVTELSPAESSLVQSVAMPHARRSGPLEQFAQVSEEGPPPAFSPGAAWLKDPEEQDGPFSEESSLQEVSFDEEEERRRWLATPLPQEQGHQPVAHSISASAPMALATPTDDAQAQSSQPQLDTAQGSKLPELLV